MDQAQQEITALERQIGADARSPLFARLADLYLAAERPKDALRVCDAGIAHFPFYSTGHLVKGRALYALSLFNEARREFEFVRDWLPFNPTIYQWIDSVAPTDDQSLTPVAEIETFQEIESVPEPAKVITPQAAAAGDFFGAITSEAAPVSATDTGDGTTAPAETNIFGLPSEAPADAGTFATEQHSTPEPDAMAAFGGSQSAAADDGYGATPATETVEEKPFSGFGASEASASPAGQAGGFATQVDSYETFVNHMRDELGPTDTMSLEDYLSTGPIGTSTDSFASPETTAEPSPVASPTPETSETPSAEPDAFAGPSLGSEVNASASRDTTIAEESPFAGPDFSGLPNFDGEPPSETQESSPAEEAGAFAGPTFDGPIERSSGGSIEELTEKLQSAKKITPVIDFTQKSASSSAEETLATSGFVTPTLAEIYAKQGWFDDAIKAYHTLARTKPAEREKYEERIAELEELKKQQGS